MPVITGAKLYLASFTLAVWMAFFNLPGPFAGSELEYAKYVLPILGTAPLPFLGIELTTMLKEFAERLAGKPQGPPEPPAPGSTTI